MGMITDEERLRVKEFIEQLEAQRKSLNENTLFNIKIGESNQCKICVLIAVVGNITTAFILHERR